MNDRNSTKCAKAEAKALYDTYTKFKFPNDVSLQELKTSLCVLSEVLYLLFGKKVFILIDEYSKPWESSDVFQNEKFLQFYSAFMEETFQTNPYLEKGIMISALPPSDELHKSALRQVVECNSLTGTFMQYFGYNQWEMKSLFEYLNISQQMQQEVNRWYGGYNIKKKNLQIYNPVSISGFAREREINKYWTRIEDATIFITNFLKTSSFKDKFRCLINGSDITVQLDREHFTWKEYEILIKVAYNDNTIVSHKFVDKAFMWLHLFGFLTMSENCDTNSAGTYCMRFPNEEIASQARNAFESRL